jgi:hypothetical protein
VCNMERDIQSLAESKKYFKKEARAFSLLRIG